MMKKIKAQGNTATTTVTTTLLSYRVWVNGRRIYAVSHNTTAEFFLVNDTEGKLHFFPQRLLRKVVIGAEFQELMRQRALATVPKPPPKSGLSVERKPEIVVPGDPAPEGEGA
jgi:hypothetical protein